MIGSQSDPGIMVRVMEDLFKHAHIQGQQKQVQYKVTVSFLEVYNENIRDLLSNVEEYLDLREDPMKGPVVSSITEIETTNSDEIMNLLHQGNSKRTQAPTAANDVSSRSHAVLQVIIECRDRAPGTNADIKVGKLSLVDLAGSERAANTKNSGQRLVEGANINRSLLALGNCINALGEKGNKGNFVPYRDSKLTRLLKDSLGGNCRTVMIANISAAESSFEETLNTLKYANRAKNIKTNIQRNVLNVNYHISEYVELINNLRGEIQLLKNQLASNESIPNQISNPAGGITNKKGQLQDDPRSSLSPTPSTPYSALRESLRSRGSLVSAGGNGQNSGEGREFVNNMRQKIVDNFQERMQLRRSLIELEDKNVQNSIEVSKRQLIVVQWSEKYSHLLQSNNIITEDGDEDGDPVVQKSDFAALIQAHGTPDIIEAWQECEQLRKAIVKNNGMKKNISKRLRHNEKDAEKFREELSHNLTGEDRRELMALQYQVGRLELENMELEQHQIIHESILKGKDLVIQKLRLQLAVKDKLINRQQQVLKEHDLDSKVGYEQVALIEETLMGNSDSQDSSNAREFGQKSLMSIGGSFSAPFSPPRNMNDLLNIHDGSQCDSFSQTADSQGSLKSITNSSVVVPILKIDSKQSKSNNNSARKNQGQGNAPISSRLKPSLSDTDDEINEEDYEVSLTEREVALSSRDRGLIEQGDWLEVQPENDSSSNSSNFPSSSSNNSNLVVGGNNIVKVMNKPMSKIKKSGSTSNNIQASGSAFKDPKVHAPRVGRIYRNSLLSNNNQSNIPSLEVENSLNNQKHKGNKMSILSSNYASDDFSDEDSKIQGKYRNYSPRKEVQQNNIPAPFPDIYFPNTNLSNSNSNASLTESDLPSGRNKFDLSPRSDNIGPYSSLSSQNKSNSKKGQIESDNSYKSYNNNKNLNNNPSISEEESNDYYSADKNEPLNILGSGIEGFSNGGASNRRLKPSRPGKISKSVIKPSPSSEVIDVFDEGVLGARMKSLPILTKQAQQQDHK